MSRGQSRRKYLWLAAVVIIAGASVGAGLLLWRPHGATAAKRPLAAAVPVTVAAAQRSDVPIFLDGLGTVQASNTVVDPQPGRRQAQSGQLHRRPGGAQGRHAGGDRSAAVPGGARSGDRPRRRRTRRNSSSAQKDLARFQNLDSKGFETQQNLDQQQAKVDQLKATIEADQGAIESAQTQLSYATITAPIDGRVGFRQVDAGNIIHANDPNPLTVLTQIRPSMVIFTLPQKNLAEVREAMLRGAGHGAGLRSGQHAPARARRTAADRQSDRPDHQHDPAEGAVCRTTTTGCGRASSCSVRIQVDTRKDAVTIPPPAVQRGPQGLYAWVVKPDDTAEQRPIEATHGRRRHRDRDQGRSHAGERVVINGQYRLQAGTRVETPRR